MQTKADCIWPMACTRVHALQSQGLLHQCYHHRYCAVRMHALIICLCCAAMFLSAGEDGTVRQVDLRSSSRTMTLIGGRLPGQSRHCPDAAIPARVPHVPVFCCLSVPSFASPIVHQGRPGAADHVPVKPPSLGMPISVDCNLRAVSCA